MVERKAFAINPKYQYLYPNVENNVVVPAKIKKEIITSIEVCAISRVNISYKESRGKESFSANLKHQYHVY